MRQLKRKTMNISWNISDMDIQKVQNLISENENAFTLSRRQRNVEKQNIVIDKETIIKTMAMCLLTSQQRSGPNSLVGQFLQQRPFLITTDKLESADNIQEFVKYTLRNNGLTRYINRISKFCDTNFQIIQKENWAIIQELIELKGKDSKKEERIIADRIAEKFNGFGPKQSRNFLQALGVTKYETPIDSRITNWLNDFGFPVALTSSPLGDKDYYHFVSDGIQELCLKAEIYPCILDAAIFSSFDSGKWTDENVIY